MDSFLDIFKAVDAGNPHFSCVVCFLLKRGLPDRALIFIALSINIIECLPYFGILIYFYGVGVELR